MTTVGSLCMGIGGLDLAVEQHFGATTLWCSEYEAAPSHVIERHWLGLHNYGDLTAIDWSTVPPVDILTAGYPCQPFSHAGKRKGTEDARHLWPYIADAVRVLRPRYVVLENVRGHLTLGFDAVLGDLAEAGFDAEWCLLRASDVGACHGRARVFIVAADAGGEPLRASRGRGGQEVPMEAPRDEASPTDASGERHGGGQDTGAVGRVDCGDAGAPRQRERTWTEPVDRSGSDAADADCMAGTTSEPQHRGRGQVGEQEPKSGVERLHGGAPPNPERLGLPWSNDTGGGEGLGAPRGEPAGAHPEVAWGVYEPAIRRWERTLGRPAPRSVDDAGRLNPPFVEWMQGFPEGWTSGLTRTQALKALGNACVPQQALAALEELAPAPCDLSDLIGTP